MSSLKQTPLAQFPSVSPRPGLCSASIEDYTAQSAWPWKQFASRLYFCREKLKVPDTVCCTAQDEGFWYPWIHSRMQQLPFLEKCSVLVVLVVFRCLNGLRVWRLQQVYYSQSLQCHTLIILFSHMFCTIACVSFESTWQVKYLLSIYYFVGIASF